jgi:hypothetical protein
MDTAHRTRQVPRTNQGDAWRRPQEAKQKRKLSLRTWTAHLSAFRVGEEKRKKKKNKKRKKEKEEKKKRNKKRRFWVQNEKNKR